MESKQFSDMPYDVITLQVKTMGVDAYAVLVHIVFCVNNIHIVSPSNQLITLKKIRSISISSPCQFHFVLYCVI